MTSARAPEGSFLPLARFGVMGMGTSEAQGLRRLRGFGVLTPEP